VILGDKSPIVDSRGGSASREEYLVTDQWVLHGKELENCICDWGCPCQFGAKSTHGRCEAFMAGHTEQGSFNDTNLDGLNWAMLMKWPGEVHEGGGTQQVIIDERANRPLRGPRTSSCPTP
jgi:hypothetical protein